MIVVSIIGILAALVIPMLDSTTSDARTESLAINVNHIRTLIVHHAGLRDVALSAGGYPMAIELTWFKRGNLPNSSWSEQPMVVDIVSGAANMIYPAVKTFDPTVPGAFSAWYNTTNGSFCALVPAMSTDEKTLALFNDANKVNASALGQTTN